MIAVKIFSNMNEAPCQVFLHPVRHIFRATIGNYPSLCQAKIPKDARMNDDSFSTLLGVMLNYVFFLD